MLKVCLMICLVELLLVPCVAVAFSICKAKKDGKRIAKKGSVKKISKFERLFLQLPWQIVQDVYSHEDYAFQENGFHLIVGEQGCGKTITVVYLLKRYKEEYPQLKIRTNMAYKEEDGVIENWRSLVLNNNGVQGQIDVLDEVQNWFNSLESKDFPVEMMQEITQQRKQRKMIMGTSQVWQRVAKPIREQVKYVYKPATLFGCLTIVGKYKPQINDEGSLDALKFRGAFFFVHTAELRNAFDTYKRIETISLKGGFKPYAEQIRKEYKANANTSGD